MAADRSGSGEVSDFGSGFDRLLDVIVHLFSNSRCLVTLVFIFVMRVNIKCRSDGWGLNSALPLLVVQPVQIPFGSILKRVRRY